MGVRRNGEGKLTAFAQMNAAYMREVRSMVNALGCQEYQPSAAHCLIHLRSVVKELEVVEKGDRSGVRTA